MVYFTLGIPLSKQYKNQNIWFIIVGSAFFQYCLCVIACHLRVFS